MICKHGILPNVCDALRAMEVNNLEKVSFVEPGAGIFTTLTNITPSKRNSRSVWQEEGLTLTFKSVSILFLLNNQKCIFIMFHKTLFYLIFQV